MTSYASIAEQVRRRKCWRGSDWAPAYFCKRYAKHYAAQLGADGVVRFKHYNNVLVEWHPDESIVIHGYQSLTSSKFINDHLPIGLAYHPGYNVVRLNAWSDKIMPTFCAATGVRLKQVRGVWRAVSGHQPIEWRTISQRTFNRRCPQWREYLLWHRAYIALGGEVPWRVGGLRAAADAILRRDYAEAFTHLCDHAALRWQLAVQTRSTVKHSKRVITLAEIAQKRRYERRV